MKNIINIIIIISYVYNRIYYLCFHGATSTCLFSSRSYKQSLFSHLLWKLSQILHFHHINDYTGVFFFASAFIIRHQLCNLTTYPLCNVLKQVD